MVTKHHKRGCLKTAEIHPLTVLEARSLKSVSAGLFLLEVLPENLFHVFSELLSLPVMIGALGLETHPSNIYFHLHRCSPLGVSVSFLLTRPPVL